MLDPQTLLQFADQLVRVHTGSGLSQVQRLVLIELLTLRPKTKTYDQIATEKGYSSGYIKLMAAGLWQLLSQVIGVKVMKSNVQKILLQQYQRQRLEVSRQDAGLNTPSNLLPTTSEVNEIKAREDDSAEPSVILVVDDQPQNVALLTDILEHDEYEVWEATCGAEALQMATKVLPDLILLDVNLPDMDGYAVCQQLKANSQTEPIPIIFVSALDDSWDQVKGFVVGGGDYITKPFNTLEVIIRIENQLKIRRIQDQRRREVLAPVMAASEETRLVQPMPPSPKAVILIVDDEPKNLTLLTNVLEQDGYEVWLAESGTEALRIAGMVLPDLILLDIKMPDMQGYDVCEQMKADAKTKRVPVIFVSALDQTWDKVKAFSVGGSDYVNKPIQVVELMARIKHQLEIWRD